MCIHPSNFRGCIGRPFYVLTNPVYANLVVQPLTAGRAPHVSTAAHDHGFASCVTLFFLVQRNSQRLQRLWLLPRLLPLCGALVPVGHSGHRLLGNRLLMPVCRLRVRVHGLLEARLLVRRDEAEDAPKLPAKGVSLPWLGGYVPTGGVPTLWRWRT